MNAKKYMERRMKEDVELKAEYEQLGPQFEIIQSLVEARIRCGMTQEQLAKNSGIDRTNISRIENGNANPSINTLMKLANGMGQRLVISFVEK